MPDHGSPGSGYGSDYDNRQYLKANGRRREQLLRQFCKLEGPSGNSNAYQESEVWCRKCFGRRMNEEGLDSCRPCFHRQPSIFGPEGLPNV